jgi:hypothetical protein
MTRSRVLGLLVGLLGAAAGRLPAQTNTAEMLQRAVGLYEQVDVEEAQGILRQIVSAAPPFTVNRDQRAQAYKYLGAMLALQPGAEKRDSAIDYFRAAITQDPAVELNAQSFTPAQLAAFAEARRQTFSLTVRPLRPDTLDSGAVTVTFRCVTSHAALLHAELRSDTVTIFVLYDGPGDGLRAITWDGTVRGGDPAPPGRYAMVVIGRSSVVNRTDSTTVYFDLQWDHPPLQDTLPDLGPQDLLPEAGSNNRRIPANIAENERRRADRAANNEAVRARNAEALRQSKRVIIPVGG